MRQWVTRSAESQARLRFIPVLEGADGNLVFEQGSRSSSGYPTRTVFSLRAQEAIRRRGTHAEQLIAARLREMQMSMLLKRFDESGEERDQPLGTHLISRFPCQKQGLLDCWSVVGETCLLAARFRLLWMIEQLNGVFAHIAGTGVRAAEPLWQHERERAGRQPRYDPPASGSF